MIGKLDHVGIAVRSIEEARKLWEGLGLSVTAIEEVPREGVRVAMIPCGESRIELLEPIGEGSPVAAFLERRGEGIHHVCLGSDDVVADDAALRAAGYRVLRPEPTPGAGGSRVQFVHPKSAHGVLVELAEPAGPPAAPAPAFPPGAAVIVNLTSPTEKYWGILGEIGVAGVTLRGIGIAGFDDWTAQAARGEERTLDLATVFFPLSRVERIFLDEPVGEVESYGQRFFRRVGRPVTDYIG